LDILGGVVTEVVVVEGLVADEPAKLVNVPVEVDAVVADRPLGRVLRDSADK
jgi:hypothetical protein